MTASVRAVVSWVAVVAAVGIWLVARGAGVDAQPFESELDSAQRLRAADLYSVHCARCHGADGRGGVSDGVSVPPLRGMPIATVDLVLRTSRMPPGDPAGQTRGPVDWPDDDREILVPFLAERFELTGDVPVPDVAGDAARGREVFAANCAQCHGYTGAGGVAGGGAFTPEVSGLDPVLIAEAIRVGPFQMPRFASEQISDDELAHVAAYLTEVAHEQGTPLGLVELNPVYASAFVALLVLVVVLSSLWISGRVVMFPDPDEPPEERS